MNINLAALSWNINLIELAKIVWIFVCTLIGLWGAGNILHDKKMKKSFASRLFEALMMMMAWVLMGILTIYFAKFFLFLIGAFLVISLVIWFKDRMNK